MFNKSFIKPILIFCTILAFTGIVYGQFTDYYERRIHNEEGYIYWEDANTQRTVQSQVRVSKYGGLLLPYVDIDEYAHCKSAKIDSQMKRIKVPSICLRSEGVKLPSLMKAKIQKPVR